MSRSPRLDNSMDNVVASTSTAGRSSTSQTDDEFTSGLTLLENSLNKIPEDSFQSLCNPAFLEYFSSSFAYICSRSALICKVTALNKQELQSLTAWATRQSNPPTPRFRKLRRAASKHIFIRQKHVRDMPRATAFLALLLTLLNLADTKCKKDSQIMDENIKNPV